MGGKKKLGKNHMLQWLESAKLETIYHPELHTTMLNFDQGSETQEDLNAGYDRLHNMLIKLGEEGITKTELEYWKTQVNQEYLIVYNNPIIYSKLILKYLNSGLNMTLIRGGKCCKFQWIRTLRRKYK